MNQFSFRVLCGTLAHQRSGDVQKVADAHGFAQVYRKSFGNSICHDAPLLDE